MDLIVAFNWFCFYWWVLLMAFVFVTFVIVAPVTILLDERRAQREQR